MEREQRLERRMDITRDRHREGVMQPHDDEEERMGKGVSREEVKESPQCSDAH